MKETNALSKINICVCTYNRVGYLKRCLDMLLPQLERDKVMLTVIDNDSADGTKDYVQDIERINKSVRYIHEPNQGLSNARNTAWRRANSEWLFYLDDDCLPSDDLIKHVTELLEHPDDIDAFGGPIEALFEDEIPHWMPEGFGNFTMPYTSTTLIENGFIRGGCFMIKRSVLESLGGFSPWLGVKGNQLQYGEEIELQLRMRLAGYKIAYAPSLKTGHFVRANKLNIKWVLQSEYARRRDKMLFDPISLPRATAQLVKTTLGRFLWIPIHIGEVIFSKQHTMMKAFYQIAQPMAYSLGELVGVIRSRKPK